MKKFVINILLSITIALFLIFILSILICKTSLSESVIKPYIVFTTGISIFIGAFFVSKSKKEKGIINGMIFGISYMCILYVISVLVNGAFLISSNSLIMVLVGIIFGIIGGIIGVNFK